LLLYKNIPCFTISGSTRKDLQRFSFQSIMTLTLGAELTYQKSYQKEKQPTLIFLGRMVGYKKPEDAIKAFEIVQKKIPDARLWMVGAGPLLEKLTYSKN